MSKLTGRVSRNSTKLLEPRDDVTISREAHVQATEYRAGTKPETNHRLHLMDTVMKGVAQYMEAATPYMFKHTVSYVWERLPQAGGGALIRLNATIKEEREG